MIHQLGIISKRFRRKKHPQPSDLSVIPQVLGQAQSDAILTPAVTGAAMLMELAGGAPAKPLSLSQQEMQVQNWEGDFFRRRFNMTDLTKYIQKSAGCFEKGGSK